MTVEDVRELHAPKVGHYVNAPLTKVCRHCTSGGDPYCYPEGSDEWPCATIRALDQPEETDG